MKNLKFNTLLSKCDPTAPIPDDLAELLDAHSVGKEVMPYSVDKSISSEEEYRAALKRIEELFDALPNTAEGDQLEKWISLIESYENDHFPM
ncbi:transcriptional regulator [Shewanella xiamenensis]|jgi:HTH-type transcriptional regulator/antitoxin HigA|uniref:transcriptional regulator n=1 Tax=Shewanella xiamenensis TaxID=332186 RepID=UPI0035BADA51